MSEHELKENTLMVMIFTAISTGRAFTGDRGQTYQKVVYPIFVEMNSYNALSGNNYHVSMAESSEADNEFRLFSIYSPEDRELLKVSQVRADLDSMINQVKLAEDITETEYLNLVQMLSWSICLAARTYKMPKLTPSKMKMDFNFDRASVESSMKHYFTQPKPPLE